VKTKAFKTQRQRIRRLEKKWAPLLGLRWWSIEYCFYDKRKRYAKATERDGQTSVASCVADWRYLTAVVSFNLPMWTTLSDAKAEWVFVHELMHIFLQELQAPRTDHMDHEERICTSLAKAFLWIRGEAAS